MTKSIGRAILAAAVAFSVAILPVAASFAAAGKAAPTAVQTSAAVAVPDCDHHRDLPSDTQKNTDGCDSMAGCALKCFTTTVVNFCSVSFIASAGTKIKQFRASDNISSQLGSPPFRPPRS